MSTAAPIALLTANEFAQMHFDYPVELVRGEIVPVNGDDGMTRPSFGHGWVCLEIGGRLRDWAKAGSHGRVSGNDPWIQTEHDPDSVRGADIAYFRMERLPDGKLPLVPTDDVPDLCVEVLSPHDRWRKVHAKIAEYLACGVQEVWVANPARRTIEVYRPEEPPTLYREGETLTSAVLPGFNCAITDCFEGV